MAELNSDKESTAKWDLTNKLSPYLDLHMMFPLLEYVDSLIEQGLIDYSSQDVATARLSLLRPTNMVDYAMDIYTGLHGSDTPLPPEMEESKAKVFETLEELRVGCRKLEDLFRNEDGTRNHTWSVPYLISSDYGIDEKTIETYKQLAKFNYDCGDYASANSMLESYLSLFASVPQQQPSSEENEEETKTSSTTAEGNPSMYYLTEVNFDLLEILWGRLSCEILLERWEKAHVALFAVKTSIEVLTSKGSDSACSMSALEALQQRTWLLHWSLFVFWNDSAKGGLEHMMDLFFSERYLQAITTNAPHLLRYLTAAVLLSKRRLTEKSTSNFDARRLLKDLVRVMQHCDYTDPIVEFVDCLCVKFNFELAQSKLAQCEAVLSTDFFLCKQTSLFMEEARVFVFENYCRIHNKIDLNALAEKLAMDQVRAERWIVDLIRNALLDAKIDSEKKCVVMGSNKKNVYEQVIDKTRDLNIRSSTIVLNLNNLLNEARRKRRELIQDEQDF